MQQIPRPCIANRSLLLAASLASFLLATPASLSAQQQEGQIIPRPQIEKLTGGALTLDRGDRVIVVARGMPKSRSTALEEGLKLLAGRAKSLGGSLQEAGVRADRPMVAFEKCSIEAMAEALRARGAAGKLEPQQLLQAYQLTVGGSGTGRVTIKASADLGLYYGILSLIQMIEPDAKGGLSLATGEIADWPELAHRLAKTSATDNAPDLVNRFAAWMPLFKIRQVGLQFHGTRSLEPDQNFTTSIRTICGWARDTGVCETVVYFCPFRGKPKNEGAYDFRRPEHRATYGQLLQGFLVQGAHGVEVDYNDWPGSPETPIEDVLNLACDAVWQKDPAAYVLWCAPNLGPVTYAGPASPEMARILSKVSPRIWPLWVGPSGWIGWRQPRFPLEAKYPEEWTRVTGRKPFLWINRVAKDVPLEVGRPIEEIPGARAFRGEDLPRDLNRLFAGVHFNAGLSKGYMKLPNEFPPEALAFLATAADFVWNPRDWEARESHRRARRFVSVMSPLLERQLAAIATESERSSSTP